jgi:hypothetical protein
MTKNRKFRLERPVPEAARFDIGYRKPPKKAQFRPGQSGNPKGRPKGARNKLPALNEERLKFIILTEAYRTIKITEGKRQKSIPMAVAIVRSVAVSAARGLHRSQRLFSEMLSETERSYKQNYDDYARTAIEYKIDWNQELERRKRSGKKDRTLSPIPMTSLLMRKPGK